MSISADAKLWSQLSSLKPMTANITMEVASSIPSDEHWRAIGRELIDPAGIPGPGEVL